MELSEEGGGGVVCIQRKSKVWMRKRRRKTKIRVFYLYFSLFFGQLVASRFIFRSSFILKGISFIFQLN